MKKKTKEKWMELLVLILTATFFALLIGNVIFYFGSDYLVPYIHLDLLTFVSLLGFGVITLVIAFLIRRR